MSTRTSTLDPTVEGAAEDKQSSSKEAIDSYLVTLEPENDPQCMSTFRRWLAVLVISAGSVCVTCASSVSAFTEAGSSQTFHVSHEVTVLGVSLFVCGLGFGPLLVGPLSEMYAFAPNIGVFLFFRLLTGFCGAAFLSVAGGSVSDMFPNSSVANPMAVYTMSPFIGPVAGPLIAGFITQNMYWRWVYWVMLCWIFVQTVLLFLFVPETYVPIILKNKAARLRKATGDASYYAPLDKVQDSLARSIIAYPVIFEDVHHFDDQMTGLAFLGIGVGGFAALFTQPFWNKHFAREAARCDGNPPPEVRLIMGQVGAILVPISLFWLAFTTYPQVHWIAPIIASVPFGSGIYFVFTSTFTYLVTAYRPIAASAMASNSALRSTFAAVFPLFAGAMYDRLGTVGATALLAGLMTIMAPLPFIFYRVGARLRMKSEFAAH
ncbi:major facilitator superfamily domain-containing protein [Lanmaoa asiatica]|nr:major facilitator superfamily domain-containing protein [Lanmaoa asiatica]